ncbi:hypothetical protein [Breoghania sp. L-A4]|uniref:hypothetical protein n=1 Tax=Breoghania sp. L-A4 TaxID=2304600 RepID=UPI000E35C66A|nr:hypothetical protein [Breoghania sp. L-A4]AXS40474.1 hypothetical protein D1F64_10890 [Breoghania sp. L-A4]
MADDEDRRGAGVVEFDFLKGHIAATMTLVHGLIAQNVIDRDALDSYFTDFLSRLPQTRQTLPLRLIVDQWRQGLREDMAETRLRRHIFEVIEGGRVGGE